MLNATKDNKKNLQSFIWNSLSCYIWVDAVVERPPYFDLYDYGRDGVLG